MKNFIAAGALATSMALAWPTTAHAADGAVCYSSVLTTNSAGGFGTTNYPQIDNNTKFTCANSQFQYTIRQLSQAGWIIDNMSPIVLSTTMSAEGSSTQIRWMITIQK